MVDERIQFCRKVMREHYLETIKNIEVGEDRVPIEDIARSCHHVTALVLRRLGADVAKDPAETYAAWLLAEKPEGEAA